MPAESGKLEFGAIILDQLTHFSRTSQYTLHSIRDDIAVIAACPNEATIGRITRYYQDGDPIQFLTVRLPLADGNQVTMHLPGPWVLKDLRFNLGFSHTEVHCVFKRENYQDRDMFQVIFQ